MTLDELKLKIGETIQEYDRKCSELKKDMKAKQSEFMDEYTRGNHRFNIGDILQFNDRYIKVDGYYGTLDNRGVFYVTYVGPELTKKLQPRKDGSRFHLYDDGRKITKIEKK